MVYCSAFNCNNDGKKMKELSFFQFPSDEKYRQIWKEKVRRLHWEPNKYSRLCSAHFEQHCYVHNVKLFESLGLPRPKKVVLKHDAVPTIFDYEDRTMKPGSEPRKRKHEDSNNTVSCKGRKMLEVIDFNSLLDDHLNALQAEEELNSSAVKKESDEVVNEIIPGSSPCEGGDKFVLLLNKPLPEVVDDIKSLLLCVRFGNGNVVPVTPWKEHMIIGEHIPRSVKPGVITVQLETNHGRVLGSTKFIYREEICAGFQKIACSTNYGAKLVKAFCNKETKKGLVTNYQEHETQPDVVTESSVALVSILRLMLYLAAKNEVVDFVEVLFRTKEGKAVITSLKNKEHAQEEETNIQPVATLQQGLTVYLENISTRLATQEEERKIKELQNKVKAEEEKKRKLAEKADLKKKLKPKEVKTKPSTKLAKAKKTSTKKAISGNSAFFSECSDMSSKTNSLLLLSDIALRHLNTEGFENGTKEDFSFSVTQSTSSAVLKKEKKHQSRNAVQFTRKIVLLPRNSTRVPPQGELLKIKTSSAVNRGSVRLENDMTAGDVIQEVRTVLSMLGKKRIRLAAADSKGKLEFFKAAKWTGRAVRQRIKSNSVLYVVPS